MITGLYSHGKKKWSGKKGKGGMMVRTHVAEKRLHQIKGQEIVEQREKYCLEKYTELEVRVGNLRR